MKAAAKPRLGRMLGRAFGLRCPWCGGRGVLKNWFSLKRECPSCGLVYDRGDGFWLGGYVINFVVTQGALILFIGVGIAQTSPSPPAIPLVLGGVAVSILVPVMFFPWSRTIWAAFDIAMHPPPDTVTPTRKQQPVERAR